MSRYYKDRISDSQINTLEYSSLRNYSFPCKETLLALLDSKEYLASDFRIAIIEICNIISVISAIYNALTTTPDKSINIAGNFSNLLRTSCFDPNHIPTYNMYISALYSLHVILEKLKTLLDS